VITLPGVGETYTLDFDQSFGQINKITFPGGGYVQYTWGPITPTGHSSPGNIGNASYQFNSGTAVYKQGCTYEFDTPAITDRKVSYDVVNVALDQQFSYNTTWSGATPPADFATRQTTVTSTDMTTIPAQVSIAIYTYGPVPADAYSVSWLGSSLPVERSILYEGGSGNVLETVNKTWGDARHVIG
jgi:hypothetical protein